MAELTSFTTVWAVLGPIATAAASAWWLRRNQVNDREHEHSLELQRLDRADAAKKLDHQRAARAERYNEIKAAIVEFMASSTEYVRKKSDYWTDPTPDNHQAASQANDKFTYSNQVVMLLGDEELSSKAIDLWNAALVVPRSWKAPANPEHEERIAKHRAARVAFNKTARAYLRSLDAHDDA